MQTKENRVIELDPEARRLLGEIARRTWVTEQEATGLAVRFLARWGIEVKPLLTKRGRWKRHESTQP